LGNAPGALELEHRETVASLPEASEGVNSWENCGFCLRKFHRH